MSIEFIMLSFLILVFAIGYAQMFEMGTASWGAYVDAWNNGRKKSKQNAGSFYQLHQGKGTRTVATYPWFRPYIGAAPTVRRTLYVPGGSSSDIYGAIPGQRPKGIY